MISRRAAAATAAAAMPNVNKAKLTNRSMLVAITFRMVLGSFPCCFMLHSAEHKQLPFRVGRIRSTSNEGVVKTRRGKLQFRVCQQLRFLVKWLPVRLSSSPV